MSLLETLICVADKGSFAAAADQLGVSQAAIGQQMKRLEEKSGQTLFDRSTGRPVLTKSGLDLVARSRVLAQEYREILSPILEDQGLSGELKLGAVPSTLTELVPAAITRLVAANPDLQLRIVSGLSVDLLGQIERGDLDAALTSHPGTLQAGLVWQELAHEALVLISSEPVDTERLKDVLRERPYIRHTRRSDAGRLAENWLAQQRIQLRPAMELESLEAVATMVSHGLGVALVPDICVPNYLFRNLHRVPLGARAGGRTLGLLSRTQDRLTQELVGQLADVILSAQR